MATEPKAPATATPFAGAAIDNEIPAYRAVSAKAVGALVLGLASVLSFADWRFLLVAGAAVVLGALALRDLRRLPDVLTGRGLANAGIGLAIVFGLSSLTLTQVQGLMLRRDAQAFGASYAKTLQEKSLAEAFWYKVPPESRKTMSPEQVLKELQASSRDPMEMEMRIAAIRNLKERLGAAPGEKVVAERVEAIGTEGLAPVAAILLTVTGPGSAKYPEKEQHALLEIKADPTTGKYKWWVEDLTFPYTPGNYVAKFKPADDGHGHDH